MIANIQLDGVTIASSPDFCLRANQGATQHCILNFTTRCEDAFGYLTVCDLAIGSTRRIRPDDRVSYLSRGMDKRRRNDFHIIECFVDSLIGFAVVEQYLVCIQRGFNRTSVDPCADLICAYLCPMFDHDSDRIGK